MSTSSSRESLPKKKVFIDCDAGVDDAQGLVLVLSTPQVEVVGISSVHGNVASKQVLKNVARVLKLFPQKVPYYEGSNKPLKRQADASFWHGLDGLGDLPGVHPAASSVQVCPGKGDASTNIVKAALKFPGQLRLIAIGPLTNVALALELEPALPSLVHSLTVMGGAEEGGNVTPSAEFNFHCDPEAAQAVLNGFRRTTLVTWDVVKRLGQPWSEYAAWLGNQDSEFAVFLEHIGRVGVAHDKAAKCDWFICDPLAVAIAIQDDLITKSKDVYCSVVVGDTPNRGQTLFDWGGQLNKEPNVNLVIDANISRVKEMLKNSI